MAASKSVKLNQPLSRKATLTVVGLLALILLFGVGAYQVYQHWSQGPKDPAQVKRTIVKYLREKGGHDNFATKVPEGLASDKAVERARGQNDANERGKRRQRRTEERPPRLAGMKEMRTQIGAAPSYEAMYVLIGQELWVADQLLANANRQSQDAGLLVAIEASQAALNNAINPWLAARICEAYLWPGMEIAESTDIKGLSTDSLLEIADEAFRGAGETNNIIRNYKFIIAKSNRGGGRADMARTRLAGVYEDMGDYKEALHCLTQIQNTNNPGVQKRIASLEQRVKAQ